MRFRRAGRAVAAVGGGRAAEPNRPVGVQAGRGAVSDVCQWISNCDGPRLQRASACDTRGKRERSLISLLEFTPVFVFKNKTYVVPEGDGQPAQNLPTYSPGDAMSGWVEVLCADGIIKLDQLSQTQPCQKVRSRHRPCSRYFRK